MHDKLIANINNNSVIIVSGSRTYLKKKKKTQSNMTCCKDKKKINTTSAQKINLVHFVNAFQYLCIYVASINRTMIFWCLYQDAE